MQPLQRLENVVLMVTRNSLAIILHCRLPPLASRFTGYLDNRHLLGATILDGIGNQILEKMF
jgi:hypothetical protein